RGPTVRPEAPIRRTQSQQTQESIRAATAMSLRLEERELFRARARSSPGLRFDASQIQSAPYGAAAPGGLKRTTLFKAAALQSASSRLANGSFSRSARSRYAASYTVRPFSCARSNTAS